MSKRQAYHLQPRPLTPWANLNRSPTARLTTKVDVAVAYLGSRKTDAGCLRDTTKRGDKRRTETLLFSNSREADTLAFRLWSKCFSSSASHPDESVPRNYDSNNPDPTAETVNDVIAHTTVAKIQLRLYATSSYSPVQTLASS
jgi:hypothetical protein